MIKTHDGSHGEDCFGCRIQTVSFAASAMPSRKPDAVGARQTEARMARDLPAYKRLKDQGLQPAATKGAAELEKRANSNWEIETGRVIPDERFTKRIDQAQKEAKEVMAANAS